MDKLTQKPIAVGGMAVYAYDAKLEKSLKRKDRFDEPFSLSRFIDGKHLLIPRELAPLGGKDLRVSGDKIKLRLSKTNKPRTDEQIRILADAHARMVSGQSFIIQASTGSGKTYIACTLAGMLSLKTLIVVQKEDLLEQWKKEAMKFLDLKESDIGVIQQGRCEVEGKKLVIAMVQSLYKEKYDTGIYKAFGLVIFDEVHHMAADKFSIAAGLFYARLRLGLSATVDRPDGRRFVFEAHIGPVAVESTDIPVPPKVLIIHSDWKLPKRPVLTDEGWRTMQVPHEHGKLGEVFKYMAKDAVRNALVVDLAYEAYKKGRWVLTLSDLARKHLLDELAKLALARGVPEKDLGFYVGGMSQKGLERTKGCRFVLATYAMCGEATDVPWWDTAVLATPRANVIQAVGRVLRPYSDKKKPVVFDIFDPDSPVLRDYFHARLKQYRSINAEIKHAEL